MPRSERYSTLIQAEVPRFRQEAGRVSYLDGKPLYGWKHEPATYEYVWASRTLFAEPEGSRVGEFLDLEAALAFLRGPLRATITETLEIPCHAN